MATEASNQFLAEARRTKKDEFYTQLPAIERELRHYKKQFQGKVVYCNCDDPRISNFFHYLSVLLQELVSGKWRTIVTGKLTSTGTYKFARRMTASGSWRVYVPTTATHLAGISKTIKIYVH